MNVTSGDARDQLSQAQAARERVEEIDVRPYGRRLIAVAFGQIVSFVTLGFSIAFWGTVGSLLVTSIFVVLVSLVSQRLLEGARKVIPIRFGGGARRSESWSRMTLIALPIATALAVSAAMSPGTHIAAGSMVILLGLAAAMPRLILGVQLWRR